ncbi:hypothetical protein NOC27_253 [Nitrosococcus oceani AFC27]|uniref:Uncharacterized protein n=2 Tax=Nitrosococcus oceani TaxID=1229 RepID=A0A0E2Z342_9GAMM|nr:hypothetical protein [Nitrosococcus oceani]EDZ66926.1 hypothetical protein NOC27_253 [Nitrosococcus oceani AFC27]KFI20108.1 hypothetical protein IB75_04940 [Nitrosococcus oceani C-27]KFI23280.1 hypothetical protein HW44_04815 [Nitrosococcus oceani]
MPGPFNARPIAELLTPTPRLRWSLPMELSHSLTAGYERIALEDIRTLKLTLARISLVNLKLPSGSDIYSFYI